MSSLPRPARLAPLRALCLLESLTLLILLFIAVPLKHVAGVPGAVSVMGPVHGLAFLVFGWRVATAVGSRDISSAMGWRLFIAAFVPFGGVYSWLKLGRSAST